MKSSLLLCLTCLLMVGCAKEDVRASIAHSLAGACRNNAGSCSLDDPSHPELDGKGAQK